MKSSRVESSFADDKWKFLGYRAVEVIGDTKFFQNITTIAIFISKPRQQHLSNDDSSDTLLSIMLLNMVKRGKKFSHNISRYIPADLKQSLMPLSDADLTAR